MSTLLTDRQLLELRRGQWCAKMSIRCLMWQFATHRRHYLGRMECNPRHYLIERLESFYFGSSRGWQRQFRRAPERLANCVFYEICCELRGRS
jgi:hypothetical protein